MAGRLPIRGELHLTDAKADRQRMKEHQPRLYKWRAAFGILVLLTCAVIGILLFRDTSAVIEWFGNNGNLGPITFCIVLTIGVVILLPTPLIKVFAGALFPYWLAVLINFTASMIGGIIAFVLGRWLFRDALLAAISGDPKLSRIESALGEEAMRISILVRLSPLIPDEWLNYILAAGPVNFRVFVTSNVSSVVYSLIYAYYGHVLGRIAFNSSGLSGLNESPMGMTMLIVGVIASIVATLVVTRVAMKALGDVINNEE